jgi:hypothetical protein
MGLLVFDATSESFDKAIFVCVAHPDKSNPDASNIGTIILDSTISPLVLVVLDFEYLNDGSGQMLKSGWLAIKQIV